MVRAALREGRDAEAIAALAAESPITRAALFLQLRSAEQRKVLVAADPALAASILSDCDSASLLATLDALDLKTLAPALRLIAPDNLADIALRVPKEKAEELLALVEAPHAEEVRGLMRFDPATAGGLMTTRYLSVPDVVTVGRAIEILRAAHRPDSPGYIYVVDANGRLAGVAPLRAMLLANPRTPTRDVMASGVVRVTAATSEDELVEIFNQHHFLSIPVVDDRERMIGIVTSDDVLAAMRRIEDRVMRGVTGADPGEALKKTLVAARGRLPWITVTILGGLGCAAVAGIFQAALAEFVVLGVFIPIVLALGESVGAQTTSVVLSTPAGPGGGAVKGFLVKEVLVGLVVGLYAGLAVAATSLLWHGNPRLGLVIGGAVFLAVSWSALLGVVIPSLVRRSRRDPTLASGPLVLALADLSTLLIYLGGATACLPVLR